jgi:DNA-binding CsgD family transcriptional regulator
VTAQLPYLDECVTGSPCSPLTRRESEILRAVAEGHTHQWIAQKAALSNRTVITILGGIRDKLGAKTTPHAVHIAHRVGVLR